MNNFTGEIKREIMKNGLENACCKTAALSAFLRTTGSVIRSGENYGFEFVTESEDVAAFFIGILEELYGAELKVEQATTDARNGRDRLVFSCLSDKSLYILGQLGIVERGEDSLEFRLDMDKYVVENACCEVAWIKGAFLGSGSCTLPKLEDTRSGYHWEIVFSNKFLADDCCRLLALHEILARCVERKGSFVVYLKSRESISDFLYLAGAEGALQKLNRLADKKDEKNRINRVANCLQKNYDKSVVASVRQIRAIERIDALVGLSELDDSLRETAAARLADKEASLKELAERLNVSKSCLNHRLRKLVKLAEELDGEE
ncbi:MAG TPA: DNA-binding protein WhiA [Candidatus Borkfalkia avistercoris]|uniref:Probable cell division protein WhiA n=1 Tax=Candidatus Borkfalkia avistercoris TaxID=2838504 RepID=A0A9D2D0K2_9FIRM|nr:DNA-binding protein WhiA [Candidatus Borkfalkia avistercoris]